MHCTGTYLSTLKVPPQRFVVLLMVGETTPIGTLALTELFPSWLYHARTVSDRGITLSDYVLVFGSVLKNKPPRFVFSVSPLSAVAKSPSDRLRRAPP